MFRRPDMRIGLELGWGGILEKLRTWREFHRRIPASTTARAPWSWASGRIRRTWSRRMAGETVDHGCANLLEIAEMNAWLVDNPRTLREMSSSWHGLIRRSPCWRAGGALGQLDELLRPSTRPTRLTALTMMKAVIWHLASLFFNDTHYSQVGGQAPNGAR